VASPISRRPSGLLDLLLTQQQGKNPALLEDDVQPIIDLGPFYEAERLETINASNAVTATGVQASTIDVPAGEYWKLLCLSIYADFGAGNQDILPFIRIRNLGSIVHVLTPRFQSSSAFTLAQGDQLWLPQPLHCPSGVSFEMNVEGLDLQGQPNILTLMEALYVRMDI